MLVGPHGAPWIAPPPKTWLGLVEKDGEDGAVINIALPLLDAVWDARERGQGSISETMSFPVNCDAGK